MSVAGPADVAFGAFRLSVRDRTLSDGDGPIPLPSRAFDVLLTLIERRAAVVSKDELMRRVWGNLVVEENNLHVQISAVRRALGAQGRCILTVPGRGYRFIGDLDGGAAGPRPGFRAGEPAAWEPDFGRTNLPAQMTPLIGRRQELAAACALFESVRLVTLVGPGGVGKTKLALAAARELAPRFAAGCWLVELAPATDAATALAALAASLKVAETEDDPLLEGVVSALRKGDILIVLDGCEHVADAVADHAGRLLQRCPRLRILCTSQTPLGVEGEYVRRIAPFDLPGASEAATAEAALRNDAVRLFAERAGAVDGRFEVTDATAASVVDICRSLDGIPLAIELAAARAPLLGLEPLRARIADRLGLLGDDRGDLKSRHRTLRAAIEWSYRLLAEPECRILRRLSVFAGGFTLTAAQEVAAGAGFVGWEVVRGLGVLVERSLIATGPDLIRPRHRMLQAMRDFVQQQPGFAEEHPAVARRHAAFFLGLAEDADDDLANEDALERLARLSPEIDNLRAALSWTLGPGGDALLGARLAAATARFWFEVGLYSEARGWLARALDRAPDDLNVQVLRRLTALAAAVGSPPLGRHLAPTEVRH
jgi:predicted ATPase/DNA-binding winged helix-turn-helix (wHTH) protein